MAGTRTHALVAGGAAAFAMAGALVVGDAAAEARVASYIVSGVGFLGAGGDFQETGRIPAALCPLKHGQPVAAGSLRVAKRGSTVGSHDRRGSSIVRPQR